MNHYYWVDDHPLLYGNNGSLDPSTIENLQKQDVWPLTGTSQLQEYWDGSQLDTNKPPASGFLNL